MRVAILHDVTSAGARPDEQDTLVQVREVSAALRALGHEPLPIEFDTDVQAVAGRLSREPANLVFNLVESVRGSARLIHTAPAMVETLGIPLCGECARAVLITTNKLMAKRLLRSAQIATPDWWCAGEAARARGEPLCGRFIIKSVWEHASIGLDDSSIIEVSSAGELEAALRQRAGRLGGSAFAERFVEGREFNLSLLAPGVVLPPAEIDFSEFPPDKPRIVDYRAKWAADSFEYRATPRRFDFPPADEDLLSRLRREALRCWTLFELRAYARVDFRVDKMGRVWVLEINTNPCLSSDAGFIAAAQRAGLALPDVLQRLIAEALDRAK